MTANRSLTDPACLLIAQTPSPPGHPPLEVTPSPQSPSWLPPLCKEAPHHPFSLACWHKDATGVAAPALRVPIPQMKRVFLPPPQLDVPGCCPQPPAPLALLTASQHVLSFHHFFTAEISKHWWFSPCIHPSVCSGFLQSKMKKDFLYGPSSSTASPWVMLG